MKKLLPIVLILLFSKSLLFSQVAINSDGSSPHPSAGLDINFANKGLLIPRMTYAEINAIESPAEGLIIYCSDCNSDASGALSIYQGGSWRIILHGCAAPLAPPQGVHTPSAIQIVWDWNTVPIASGYKWNSTNDTATAIDVGVLTSYTETGLDCWKDYTRYVWAYNDCGLSHVTVLTGSTLMDPFTPAPTPAFQLPTAYNITWSWWPISSASGYRWNTTDDPATAIVLEGYDNIVYVEEGLTCMTPFTRYIWAYDECGISSAVMLSMSTTSDPPPSPAAGVHVPAVTQIVWNWNTVTGADGYKWNTVNNYGTATDMGVLTSKTETGLTCNSPNTSYVWAYGDCGESVATELTQVTLADPPAAPSAGTHNPTPVQIVWNWNTVSGATGYKWNTVNDFGSAEDMGSALTKTQTGLTCNTPYTSYVWAYGICGVSASTPLSQSTALDPPADPVAGTHTPSPTGIVWNWNTVTGADGYKWNTSSNYGTAEDMGPLTSKTESSLTCNTPYTRYVWSYNECGVSSSASLIQSTSLDPPAAPGAGTHNPTPVQITWNWNTVSGATGYKWNTANDYGGAEDMGSATSKLQTGLTCNTSYTAYVWAYSSCGVSTSASLIQSTSLDPPVNPTAGSHFPSLTEIVWNWNTVPGATGYKWHTSNDYENAENMNTVTSKTETGLACNLSYTRCVWAYSDCGVSPVTSLNQATTQDPPDAPLAATHVPSPDQIIWKWYPVDGATGYKWNTTSNYGSAQDMATDTARIDTLLTCNSSYTRYIWAYSACGVSEMTALIQSTSLNPPAAPVAGTHIPTPIQIVWKWNAVTGAEGYKWNTENNYGTAQDMGTALAKTQTGLTCNTSYTSYVWAYSSCGVSASTPLNQMSSTDTPDAPAIAVNIPLPTQVTWKWRKVTGATGYKWHTSDDYNAAANMGTDTSKVESGLVCNTSYDRYVWAYNDCDESVSTTLTQITSLDPPASPGAGTHVPALNQIEWNWNTVPGATGYKWNTTNVYGTAQDMAGVTTKTESSLCCDSAFTRYVWAYSDCGVSGSTALTQATSQDPPDAAVAGSHTATESQIVWAWDAVTEATGYKWNTINNYATAQDMGANLTKTQDGLACNSTYTSYVWAYGNCGISSATSLSQATTADVPDTTVSGTHTATSQQITWNWNAVSGASGYKWNTTDDYSTATNIGTSLSKIETGLSCNTAYTRYVWTYNDCGNSGSTELTQTTSSAVPNRPSAGTHVPGFTQIVWKWSLTANTTGFYWSTVDNFSLATDIGLVTSYTETGLVCSTLDTSYVWSYNACGVSTSSRRLISSTLTCWTCGANIPIDHVAGSVAPVSKSTTYGTVTSVPGEPTKCWITQNLGADNQATSTGDNTEASAGWYWQFNRKQGYKHDGTTRTPNTTWITSIIETSHWASANDPCALELGTGWRVPTATEWTNVDGTGGGNWGTNLGPWNSVLKMHMAGYLKQADGTIMSRGTNGTYWGSTQSGDELGWRLFFSPGGCAPSTINKTYGYTIRCIKN